MPVLPSPLPCIAPKASAQGRVLRASCSPRDALVKHASLMAVDACGPGWRLTLSLAMGLGWTDLTQHWPAVISIDWLLPTPKMRSPTKMLLGLYWNYPMLPSE